MARRKKGSGQVLERHRGRWEIRWWEGGKRCSRGGFHDRKTAQRVLTKVLGEVVQQRAGMPPDPRNFPPLSELAAAWLDRRDSSHRSADDDRCRWDKHLGPAFGGLRASEVDAARIRAFVESKLRGEVNPKTKKLEKLNPATVQRCIRTLSTFYSDLCERPSETGAVSNPCRTLPRSTRRLMRPTWDWKHTPSLAADDMVRVYRALRDGNPEEKVKGHLQTAVAFATGGLAGLRTGEILGLSWKNVDLDRCTIYVREQCHKGRLGPPKDDESRTPQIQDALHPILTAWKLKTGGEGLLFKPDRPGRRAGRVEVAPSTYATTTPSTFMRPRTLHLHLRAALKACKLPTDLTWYQATRHTYSSLYVANGGSLEKLAQELGHSSTEVTRRYAHLRPDHFQAADRRLLAVDLNQGPAEVVQLKDGGLTQRVKDAIGHPLGTEALEGARAEGDSPLKINDSGRIAQR